MIRTIPALQSKSGIVHRVVTVDGVILRPICCKTTPKGAKSIEIPLDSKSCGFSYSSKTTCKACINSSGVRWYGQEPPKGSNVRFY